MNECMNDLAPHTDACARRRRYIHTHIFLSTESNRRIDRDRVALIDSFIHSFIQKHGKRHPRHSFARVSMENRKTTDARASVDACVRHDDSYYASAYNDAPSRAVFHARDDGDECINPWGLRGFVPPKRFRVAGYGYAHAEDSARVYDASSVMTTTMETKGISGERASEDGDDGDGYGARGGRREHETRRRASGTMTSRPSWTGTVMTRAAAC